MAKKKFYDSNKSSHANMPQESYTKEYPKTAYIPQADQMYGWKYMDWEMEQNAKGGYHKGGKAPKH